MPCLVKGKILFLPTPLVIMEEKRISFTYNKQKIVMPDTGGWLSKHFHQGAFYEGHMLYAIAALENSGVYIDVGGNLGNHSVFFEMFCPSTKVITFEPLEETWALLMKTRKMNNLSFEAHKVGLSDKEEEFETKIGQDNYVIRTITLDSFELNDVSVIKIDIEGMEVNALKGMRNTLTRCHPHLFIEAHTDEDLNAQSAVLSPLGYARTGRFWNASPTYEWTHSG